MERGSSRVWKRFLRMSNGSPAFQSPASRGNLSLVQSSRRQFLIAWALHPEDTFRRPLALRLLMNASDWVQGLPVGYSYWECYQAPAMLDEIAVHHEYNVLALSANP